MKITAETLEAVATEQLKATKKLPARYDGGDTFPTVEAVKRSIERE